MLPPPPASEGVAVTKANPARAAKVVRLETFI
jgi:hypothetical protein